MEMDDYEQENLHLEDKKIETPESLLKYWIRGTQRRTDFLADNSNPQYEEFETLLRNKKLDSTLRKCTAFVKKMKNFNPQQGAEKDLEGLNLSKYLSEICTAILENRYKDRNQVWEMVGICSKLHQRYREFSSSLSELYKTKFSSKIAEGDWTGLSHDLRLLTELVICGVIVDDGVPMVGSCLRQLVSVDKASTGHSTIMLMFMKEFAFDVAGIFPEKVKQVSQTNSTTVSSKDLINPQKKLKIRHVIQDYIQNVFKNLIKMREEVNIVEIKRQKLLKTKGEISKEREDARREIVTSFETFLTVAKKLSLYSGIDLPVLEELAPIEEEDDDPFTACSDSPELDSTSRICPFEDEESRLFYQQLPDLSKYLTSAARRENILALEKQAAEVRAAEENLDVELEMAELQSEISLTTAEVDLEPDLEISSLIQQLSDMGPLEEGGGLSAKYSEYLLALRNCVNRNMIDEAADLFLSCYHQNKANTKKLTKTLIGIPRQRTDLLPLWSRLIAILYPVVPEVGMEVVDHLNKDLRGLIRRCHPTFIETKLKVIKFIAELVKFEVFPVIQAFACLRLLLVNFVHHQIDMACAFVESCGRYLYNNQATRSRMKVYMDVMMRKKQAKVLSQRYNDLVDQAFLAVYPVEGVVRQKEISAIEAYLQELLYYELTRKKVDTTIATLRRVDWSDSKNFLIGIRMFSRPWKMPANRYSITCSVLSGLREYQPVLGTCVADTVILLLIQRLHVADTLNNQHLMSLAGYMCELFCYKMYSCEAILQVLYALITRGITFDSANPSEVDPPQSTFRLRLATVLLKGCGDYFLEKRETKTKLKYFTQYLQRYMYFKKEHPVWEASGANVYISEPFHVVEDLVIHLFPKMKVLSTYEVACKMVEMIEAKLRRKYTSRLITKSIRNIVEKPDSEEPSIGEDNRSLAGIRGVMDTEDSTSTEGYKDTENTQLSVDTTLSPRESNIQGDHCPISSNTIWNKMVFENDIVDEAVEAENHTTNEMDDEFDRQLERFRNEAMNTPRDTRIVNTDIRIPMNLQKGQEDPNEEMAGGMLSYAILLKKGNKTNLKRVQVPEDAEFVARRRHLELVEQRERAQLKERTLRINRMQIAEELGHI